MDEELRKRLTETPDRYTVAWWKSQLDDMRKGYRGATHGINRCLAEYEDLYRENVALRQRCDVLEAAMGEANAKLGEFGERIDRMAAFLTSLKLSMNGKDEDEVLTPTDGSA